MSAAEGLKEPFVNRVGSSDHGSTKLSLLASFFASNLCKSVATDLPTASCCWGLVAKASDGIPVTQMDIQCA